MGELRKLVEDINGESEDIPDFESLTPEQQKVAKENGWINIVATASTKDDKERAIEMMRSGDSHYASIGVMMLQNRTAIEKALKNPLDDSDDDTIPFIKMD